MVQRHMHAPSLAVSIALAIALVVVPAFPSAGVTAAGTGSVGAAGMKDASRAKPGKDDARKSTRVVGWKAARLSPSSVGRVDSLRVTGPRGRVVKVQKKSAGRWKTVRVMRTSAKKQLDVGFIREAPGRWRLKVPARGVWRGTTTATLRVRETQLADVAPVIADAQGASSLSPGTGGQTSTPPATTTTVSALTTVGSSGVYGTGFNSDTLANLNMGGQWLYTPSYRFQAAQSSTLSAIRIHLLEPTHGPGYGGGTGGRIRVTVQTDNNGIPSGTVLATREFVWADSGGSNFPLFTFASPATLTAGTRYHLVFSNIDANPATNYMSINTMYVFGEVPVPRQPGRSDSDYFTALMKQGSTWSVKGGYTPNIDLTYGNGTHQGQGVIDIDTAHGSVISGTNNIVRERITVSGGNRVVSGAAVRIAKTSGTGNLVVRLEDANGTLIDSFSASTAQVPVLNSAVDGKAGVWVSGTFTAPRTLTNGATYNLRLSTDSATSLWTRGIQTGRMYGFHPSTYFDDGLLEVSTNAGSTWSQVPGLGQDGDLQFYLN